MHKIGYCRLYCKRSYFLFHPLIWAFFINNLKKVSVLINDNWSVIFFMIACESGHNFLKGQLHKVLWDKKCRIHSASKSLPSPLSWIQARFEIICKSLSRTLYKCRRFWMAISGCDIESYQFTRQGCKSCFVEDMWYKEFKMYLYERIGPIIRTVLSSSKMKQSDCLGRFDCTSVFRNSKFSWSWAQIRNF